MTLTFKLFNRAPQLCWDRGCTWTHLWESNCSDSQSCCTFSASSVFICVVQCQRDHRKWVIMTETGPHISYTQTYRNGIRHKHFLPKYYGDITVWSLCFTCNILHRAQAQHSSGLTPFLIYQAKCLHSHADEMICKNMDWAIHHLQPTTHICCTNKSHQSPLWSRFQILMKLMTLFLRHR